MGKKKDKDNIDNTCSFCDGAGCEECDFTGEDFSEDGGNKENVEDEELEDDEEEI